jgi:hypothetical protein
VTRSGDFPIAELIKIGGWEAATPWICRSGSTGSLPVVFGSLPKIGFAGKLPANAG